MDRIDHGGILFVASLFVQHIAIAETTRMQSGFLAASLRLLTVFVLSLHVAASMVREFNDKGVELLLALDLPRAGYYLGRFAGFAAIAGALALLAGAVADRDTKFRSGLVDGQPRSRASVGCRACAVLRHHFRSNHAGDQLRLGILPVGPRDQRGAPAIAVAAAVSQRMEHSRDSWLVDALAWLLPDLSRFTLTTWLVDDTPGLRTLAFVAMQSLLYSALLVCAGLTIVPQEPMSRRHNGL